MGKSSIVESERSYRILIADDHPIVRDGLREILAKEGDFEVVGEAGSGEETLEMVRRVRPDILVLDVEMPKKNGLEVAEVIRSESLPVKILILTMYHQESIFNRAMDTGVAGYVLKDNVGTDIIRAIRAVLKGEYYISPELTKYAIRGKTSLRKSGMAELTNMERKILQMIASSRTTNQIAEELHLSPRTIEHHRANICQKLNLSGSYALLRYALENKGDMSLTFG